jgi:hypothetical protein
LRVSDNGIPVTIAQKEYCCGMPKLELGDLASVQKAKEQNIPQLAQLVDQGGISWRWCLRVS